MIAVARTRHLGRAAIGYQHAGFCGAVKRRLLQDLSALSSVAGENCPAPHRIGKKSASVGQSLSDE